MYVVCSRDNVLKKVYYTVPEFVYGIKIVFTTTYYVVITMDRENGGTEARPCAKSYSSNEKNKYISIVIPMGNSKFQHSIVRIVIYIHK